MSLALPSTRDSPLLRTSHTRASSTHWTRLQKQLSTPTPEGFLPNLTPLDDPSWSKATPSELAAAAAAAQSHLVIFIADDQTLSDTGAEAGYPILVVEADPERLEEEARTFRCVARELWSVENNLSLCNMNWEEFEAVLQDGVFVGFGQPAR